MSSYHPKKELLEVIGNLVPIDIQIETHGAKFAIKVFQQTEDDRILRLFENSKSTITRKLLADRTFGSLILQSRLNEKNSLQKMEQPIEEFQLRISGQEKGFC